MGDLVDVTAATPLLVTPSPLGNDCGKFLIAFSNDYEIDGAFWHPTVVDVGGTLYFAIPCKYSDMFPWSLGLATYTPTPTGTQTATWLDGIPGMAGVNEFITPDDLTTTSIPIGGLGNLAIAWNGSSVFGLGAYEYNYVGPKATSPVAFATPTQLAATAYDVNRIGAFDLATNDSTWSGATSFERSILYRDGVYNIFTMHHDAPAETTMYVAVHQSMTGADVEFATAPLLTNAGYPIVAGDANHIFLITIDQTSENYVIREAATIPALATATPQPLDLLRFQGPAGAWNHDLFGWTPRGEPRIFGAVVENGSLLIFYLAGDTDYMVGTAPYGAPRAIGILSQPVQ